LGSLILADAASSMLSCRDPHAAIEPGVDAVGSYYIIGRILHRFLHCLMKITFMQARPANRRLLAPGPPGLAALRGGRPGAPAGGSRQGHSLMGAGFVNGDFCCGRDGSGPVNQLQQACHSAHSRPDTNCEWWLKVLEPGSRSIQKFFPSLR